MKLYKLIALILLMASVLVLIVIDSDEQKHIEYETHELATNSKGMKINTVPDDNDTLIPISIIINNEKALIEPVGLTQNGAMGTANGPDLIAWYQYGSLPGEEGNSLLAGHRDWGGELELFHNLEELKLGTEIQIELSNGEIKLLELQETKIFHKDKVPDYIMRVDGDERTTLITCSGKYLKDEGTYEDRVISIFKVKN